MQYFRRAYQPLAPIDVLRYTGWHTDFGLMHELLLMYGFEHYDNLYEITDGISSARKYRTLNLLHLVTLWKNGSFEISRNYQLETEEKGSGLEMLLYRLKLLQLGKEGISQ